VDDNGAARETKVKIGKNSGISAQVLEGLQMGEKVILHPPDSIKEGVKVALAE
jgi:HlyD family secretion protein